MQDIAIKDVFILLAAMAPLLLVGAGAVSEAARMRSRRAGLVLGLIDGALFGILAHAAGCSTAVLFTEKGAVVVEDFFRGRFEGAVVFVWCAVLGWLFGRHGEKEAERKPEDADGTEAQAAEGGGDAERI